MAHEFFLWAQNDTQYYDPLPPGVLAAFSIYLIKNGERTHCCSLTPSSWGVWIADEYLLYNPSAEPPDIYTSDQSNYFGFTPHNPNNPHHGPLFTFDGRFSSEKAWTLAEEDACANPHYPNILCRSNFDAHQRSRNLPLTEGLFAP